MGFFGLRIEPFEKPLLSSFKFEAGVPCLNLQLWVGQLKIPQADVFFGHKRYKPLVNVVHCAAIFENSAACACVALPPMALFAAH
jgi:hypothetical protein